MKLRALAVTKLAQIGPKYMPFADAASAEVPLSRLLRLSLFQVTVGMALVLLLGTLNRVMIVELNVPASLVAAMISLPLVFAPFRALIGFKSDTHKSALGLRRLPYIWKGTMLQFGGFAIMPFALLYLSGYADAADAPRWIGYASAALAFLLVGAGVHMVQTVGLALATDLVPQQDQPKVVGLMYVMLLVGMIASAFVFGALLEPYTPGRLIQVIQGSAVVTIVLNGCAMWKQEARNRARGQAPAKHHSFSVAWGQYMSGQNALRLLVLIGLGTAGFGMADVLLEPYGGQALGMSVAQTTKLTAILAGGGLVGFVLASRWLGRGGDALRMASLGAVLGMAAFMTVILSFYSGSAAIFLAATVLAGFAGGLFSHGTLTATMQSAPKEQIGLSLGAWGAVQATCAGVAIALGGLIRDVIVALQSDAAAAPELPYMPVFALQGFLLAAALWVAIPLLRNKARHGSAEAYAP